MEYPQRPKQRGGPTTSVSGGAKKEYPQQSRSSSVNSSTNFDEITADGRKQANITVNELVELHEENSKLRDIEKQFWRLLTEREDLTNEVNILRSSGGTTGQHHYDKERVLRELASGDVSLGQQQQPAVTTSSDAQKLREDFDKMSVALNECMELLLRREDGMMPNLVSQRGPVGTFLVWLEMEENKNVAHQSVVEASHALRGGLTTGTGQSHSPQSSSPSGRTGRSFFGDGGGLTDAERTALNNELRLAKAEIKQLQEELDRTDLSRMQALEDSERLQRQMETLSQNLSELRTAYASVKGQANAAGENAQLVLSLRTQLADRDAEIGELRARVAQLHRLTEVGGAQLAADAARIKQEFSQRQKSTSPEPSTTVGA